MSGTLLHYAKMVFTATIDLFGGVGIGLLNNYMFSKLYSTDKSDAEQKTVEWVKDILLCSLQVGSSVIIGEQIRMLFFPVDFNDPTGGIVFGVALLLPQTLIWMKTKRVFQESFGIIRGLFKMGSTTNSGRIAAEDVVAAATGITI